VKPVRHDFGLRRLLALLWQRVVGHEIGDAPPRQEPANNSLNLESARIRAVLCLCVRKKEKKREMTGLCYLERREDRHNAPDNRRHAQRHEQEHNKFALTYSHNDRQGLACYRV
jgi:hypothetical protein